MAAPTSTAPGWSAASSVLVMQLCFGFAFHGATANTILLLERYGGYSESRAEVAATYLVAVLGLASLAGGRLSDSVLGCFNSMVVGALMVASALVGLCLATSWTSSTSFLRVLVFLVLPLGHGLFTANAAVLGATQFNDIKGRTSWFSWFYLTSNIGSCCAYVIAGALQQNYSFSFGLAVPCAVLLVGVVIFVAAKPLMCNPLQLDAAVVDPESGRGPPARAVWRKVLPVMLLTVSFYICHAQLQSTWYVQGLWMRRDFFGHELPVSGLFAVDTVLVMATVAALEGSVFPVLKRAGRMPGALQRLTAGLVLAALAMYAAHRVEQSRLAQLTGLLQPSALHMAFQLPQVGLLAAAQVLVFTASQDYTFEVAPARLLATMNSLHRFLSLLGTLLAAKLIGHCSSWIPSQNPNVGHYDKLFLVISVSCLASAMGMAALQREAPKPSLSKQAHGKGDYGSMTDSVVKGLAVRLTADAASGSPSRGEVPLS